MATIEAEAAVVATSVVPSGTHDADTTDGSPPARTAPARCSGEPAAPRTHRYRDVAGVDPDLLSLDVYASSTSASCPVVVWVHGGGWRTGDKQGRAIDTKAAYFTRLGYVLVAVNYRLASADNDVRWPQFGDDVAAAIDWVIVHAGDLGADAGRLALVGHSAGAHLASIVATNPDLLVGYDHERAVIDCIVGLDSASYDLTDRPGGSSGIVAGAFGTDPSTLAAASPLIQLMEHGGRVADVALVTRGGPSRRAGAAQFAARITAAGADSEVLDANPCSHEEVNDQLGRTGETVVTPFVTAFLQSCLGGT